MKLMLNIIRDEDAEAVTQRMIEHEFRVTRMASTGGFLRHGNSTLLVGVEDDRVNIVIDLLQQVCQPVENAQRRATIFVLHMNQFLRV